MPRKTSPKTEIISPNPEPAKPNRTIKPKPIVAQATEVGPTSVAKIRSGSMKKSASTPEGIVFEPFLPSLSESIPGNTKAKPARSRKMKSTVATDIKSPSEVREETSVLTPVAKVSKRKVPALKQEAKKASSEKDEELSVMQWRAVSTGVQPAAPKPPSAPRKRAPSRSAAAETPSPVLELPPVELGDDFDLEVSFRPRTEGLTIQKTTAPRTRRATPTTALELPQEEPKVILPEPPTITKRAAIPIPENAPQVILREGLPTLVKDGRAYPPIMFFGNSPDQRRATIVQEEMRLAGEAGIHLHSHFLEFPVDIEMVEKTASIAGFLLKASLEADPKALVTFRIVFSPAKEWSRKYPNGHYSGIDGYEADPSICDDAFWDDAGACLEKFVSMLRLLPDAAQILGIHLDRAEWFAPAERGYDTSKSAQTAFRKWARTRYSEDEVTLRASWFDGRASFDNLTIPTYSPTGSGSERFVRASRKQRRYVDYHLFLSDVTVERIGNLAYSVKKASDGMFLVGASYGYTFEWSHPGNGHLALGKLLRSAEVDFIAGPPSYKNREPGGTSPFPSPIDSVALNGKLYISEEDFKTSLSGGHEPDDFNPMIKTPQALESVHWRGAGAAIAHGSGVSWMDLWGNGWLKTASIWKRGEEVKKALTQRMAAPIANPDVVVFIDERALAYLVDPNAFSLLVQNVRESILRSGLSAGFYLLSDLAHREKFPEGKLYLFLNAWDIRPELRTAIKTRLQRDKKVLFWLYAAGMFDGGRESLERAREVTGIALKPQPFHSKAGTTILSKRHPLCEAFPDRGLGGSSQLEPSYFAIPEEAIVLGEYAQTGLPSFVVKEFSGDGDPSLAWKSVFLGEPIVSPALIRALGQMAGAHVYNFQEDVVHVGLPFLTVHCQAAGQRALMLPPNWAAFSLQSQDFVQVEGNAVRFIANEGSTHCFMVGPKEELEAIRSTSTESLLKVDHIPPREMNTLGDRDDDFDIPIMKLGAWMEGGITDEVSEDWLLRPPTPEPEEPFTEELEPGRRRRNRRPNRSGGRGGDESSLSSRHIEGTVENFKEDGFEMNVVFRKRE